MGSEHAQYVQLLPYLFQIGDWDHLFEALFEARIQIVVTRDGSR